MTDQHTLFEKINDALPQTQCTQCGFEGCAPYARAIAFDETPINQCPPGGHNGIVELAHITGRPVIPLNPKNGIEQALHVAYIVESECIGCTKCIQACPVDAIVGASKLMHTVLTDWCTGCGLCVPPCPVDCIEMPLAQKPNWQTTDAQVARTRYEFRNFRLIREQNELQHKRTIKNKPISAASDNTHSKQSMVEAALVRARARRQS